MGEQFTVADGYLFVVLGWGARAGIDLAQWPQLQGLVARVGARPNVIEALKSEGLAK
jgi:glutathione S-transferase